MNEKEERTGTNIISSGRKSERQCGNEHAALVTEAEDPGRKVTTGS